jgi:peptidoglycan/LPS O-acetylase OafA/YrhL
MDHSAENSSRPHGIHPPDQSATHPSDQSVTHRPDPNAIHSPNRTAIQSPDRFDVDALRGIVCLSLASVHFFQMALRERAIRFAGEWIDYAVWNLRFGVESFLVLAGLLLAHNLRPRAGESISVKAYLIRRFFRLVIPYWVAVMLATANLWLPYFSGRTFDLNGAHSKADYFLWSWPADTGHSETGNDNPSPPPTAKMMLVWMSFTEDFFQIGSAAPGYWSMVTLEQFYLLWLTIFALSAWFFRRTGTGDAERLMRWMSLLTFFAGVAAGLWIFYRASLVGEETVSGANSLHVFNAPFKITTYSFFLSLGMTLYWAIRNQFAQIPFFSLLLLLIVMVVYTNLSRTYAALITAMALIPICQGMRLPDWGVIRFLRFVGRYSYSIYLIHAVIGLRFLYLAEKKLAGQPDWWVIPLWLAAIGISIGAGWVFYLLVERPSLNFARRFEYRSSGRS